MDQTLNYSRHEFHLHPEVLAPFKNLRNSRPFEQILISQRRNYESAVDRGSPRRAVPGRLCYIIPAPKRVARDDRVSHQDELVK